MEILQHPEGLPPRKEDTLFQFDAEGTPYWTLLNDIDITNGIYADGYSRAAQVLLQHVTAHPNDRYSLVYPILFLYRHQIELVLKNLLRRSLSLLDRKPSEEQEKKFGSHQLTSLWKECRSLLDGVCTTHGVERIPAPIEEAITSYIEQLSEVDEGSYNFRYAYSKKRALTLPKSFHMLNLHHFAELMDRLICYLDSVDASTSELADIKEATDYGWPL